MRRVKIFSGSSHPLLTAAICDKLGTQPAICDLTKFSNGEISVSIGTSIRDQDVFIVQSGSTAINDSVMELLIMISACKGGSARSITAVVPYFPYSRQSKKKSHRGAITARMLANLLSVAGVQRVVTVDLHASPIQGFFGKPVDNLRAEPLIARWIRNHVPDWQDAVVVSKNAGGSKRVTSLADALKLSFGIITTDRRRSQLRSSTILNASPTFNGVDGPSDFASSNPDQAANGFQGRGSKRPVTEAQLSTHHNSTSPRIRSQNGPSVNPPPQALRPLNFPPGTSALSQSTGMQLDVDELTEIYNDERAQEVITGRLIQGHIVDDDFPSPNLSAISASVATLPAEELETPRFEERDPMLSSFVSTVSSLRADALGGTYDATASDEEEEVLNNPEVEHTITLVGNVKDRTALIIDDMIDRSESWIAAAETVVKRGGAKKVYCIATHGLFGEEALESMERCDCIDFIVVCNTFPIDANRVRSSKKLVVLDLSGLLSEAIRRNHYGESISHLYQFYQD